MNHISDAMIYATAEALSEIQNYPQSDEPVDTERFEAYLARIRKRALFLSNLPDFRKAYDLFLERQHTAPRTLSHGDLGQFNVCERNGCAVIIDWGFGGILPYSLDIARFIAHTSEDGQPFGMYMTQEQKQLFVDTVYEKLKNKPDYAQYLYDIKLALLNEYVEFLEGMGITNHWYFSRASKLVEEILAQATESPGTFI